MNILFIFPREKEYNSQTVREFPSGGTEKAVIFLGEAFQKLGHSVEWITTLEQMGKPVNTPDVVITQEAELFTNFPKAKKVWWCHHFTDQPIIKRNSGYGRALADKIVTLSKCQQKDFHQLLRLDSVVIGHGVWLEELAHLPSQAGERLSTGEIIKTGGGKDPYRLIYAATPFRGLERIPALFRKIKEAEPRATIAICSSMATYGTPEADEQYRGLFDELRSIPGVELLGSLNQEQLYKEYAKASIFFYPCTWPETYCLALDEALAHGCYPVVSRLGALPERAPFVDPTYGDLRFPDAVVDYAFKGKITHPITFKPKDWLDIGRQWEREVLDA